MYIYSIWALNRGYYPYKWLWTYAGDKFFEAEGEIKFSPVYAHDLLLLQLLHQPLHLLGCKLSCCLTLGACWCNTNLCKLQAAFQQLDLASCWAVALGELTSAYYTNLCTLLAAGLQVAVTRGQAAACRELAGAHYKNQ